MWNSRNCQKGALGGKVGSQCSRVCVNRLSGSLSRGGALRGSLYAGIYLPRLLFSPGLHARSLYPSPNCLCLLSLESTPWRRKGRIQSFPMCKCDILESSRSKILTADLIHMEPSRGWNRKKLKYVYVVINKKIQLPY